MAQASSSVITESPIKVLVLGHSFVHRASDYIDLNPTLANLGLSSSTHEIHFIGRPGYHARTLRNCFRQVNLIRPSLVLLDIGTNDLTYMSPDALFSQVYAVAKDLVVLCGVSRVVLLQVLPRTVEGRWGQPESFTDKVNWYNILLKGHVYQNILSPIFQVPSTPISYWFQKGFRQDISSLISDGVHLNEVGLPPVHPLPQACCIKILPLCMPFNIKF